MTAASDSMVSPQQAAVDAALLVLKSMGLSLDDLTGAPANRKPAPTFAEYVPVVAATVTKGTLAGVPPTPSTVPPAPLRAHPRADPGRERPAPRRPADLRLRLPRQRPVPRPGRADAAAGRARRGGRRAAAGPAARRPGRRGAAHRAAPARRRPGHRARAGPAAPGADPGGAGGRVLPIPAPPRPRRPGRAQGRRPRSRVGPPPRQVTRDPLTQPEGERR